ncbi:type IV secretory system conjugative DNA transfer family protein [Sphingobium sp. MK2]|uniref:type IV secretory system conjugative DNA transfer family protein n=1 Tax=Sphingobium sp. MK2 TaxID=3116540 RepID=UPI0032E36003
MHHREAATSRTKMQRALMTPDEILGMADDQMINFISGLDVPPILANKYPYYMTRSLNGLWQPNPLHPPLDRVKLPGMFGGSWHRVITADVTPELAHFPQYADGRIRYVDSHRPW